MRNIISFSIVMILICAAHASFAQSPGMWIYFNEGLTQGIESQCPPSPPGTVIDSIYIVAESFPTPISQIEYCVNYPSQLIYILDVIPSGTAEGYTSTGIVQSWESPQDASMQLLLAKVVFIWMCQACHEESFRICVDTNPNTGFLRALTWPDLTAIYPDSWKALVCPLLGDTYPEKCPIISGIPVEQTCWGSIKLLYK